MKNKVAIIGSGYTGLSCAKILSEKGYDVTIFEETNEIRWNCKMHRLLWGTLGKKL